MHTFRNIDCIEGMKEFPDKFFDLAIVDPPWGEDRDLSREEKIFTGLNLECFKQPRPSKEYFDELFRVSQNQVIWGGNYFTDYLQPTGAWLIWRKNFNSKFHNAEMAWTSFRGCVRVFDPNDPNVRQKWGEDFIGRDFIHPMQKPEALYEWVLSICARREFNILDTHVGSGSSLLAFKKAGCSYCGFELVEDYYISAKRRLEA